MSLFTKVIQAVQSWRRRRGATKSRTAARVGLEQLDHRQLLAVNFTGVVANDFPVTKFPGVVTITGNGNPAGIPGNIQSIVKVSGFTVSGMAVSYDSKDDSLSVGLIQPASGNTPYPVMAGDADNNGDSGSTNPAIPQPPTFTDVPDMQGSETMGAFLNFSGGTVPQVVAGFSGGGSVNTLKTYAVADALPPGPGSQVPNFGTTLTANTGNVYLVNDPAHGALEFSIKNFSQLYKAETGQTLTPQSVIKIGAFGSSNQDGGIGESTYPATPFTLSQATLPPPTLCPPVSPPVLINPHSSRHINTAHGESVRVTIQSTSGFDATQIDPSTVRLGGAKPFTSFTRNFNHSDFPSVTFVFRGYDISLPAGITPATVTGQLYDGTKFATTELVYNKNDSFYTPAQIAARDAKLGFQPPEELALEMASANANGNIATINANILAANATSATAAETIPSNYSTFAPITSIGSAVTPAVMSSPMGSMTTPMPAGTMSPTVITPSVVSIPKRTTSVAKSKPTAPSARMAAAMQRGGLAGSNKNVLTSTTSSALAAHDAALANFAS